MTQRNPGRLAIHRRSDEIAFLQQRLRALGVTAKVGQRQAKDADASSQPRSERHDASTPARDLRLEALLRERDLADELLHTRQIEPLGETLQRRLAMAERVHRDLAVPQRPPGANESDQLARDVRCEGPERSQTERGIESGDAGTWKHLPDALWVAKIERQALTDMLEHWWAWLRKS